MKNRIEILGIQLNNYYTQDQIRTIEVMIDGGGLLCFEEVDLPMMMNASEDPAVCEVLKSLNMALLADPLLMQIGGNEEELRIREIENRMFAMEFLRLIERRKYTVHLIGDKKEQVDDTKELLEFECPKMVIKGTTALEQAPPNMDSVVNEINSEAPDVLISVLPSPMQEQFLRDNRGKLCIRIWYGAGDRRLTDQKGRRESRLRSRRWLSRLKKSMKQKG